MAEPGGAVTWLRVNIPTRVGGARIAAGNIWEKEAETGLSAQLWVMDPDPAFKKNFRVRTGQEFDVSGAHVRVVSIAASGVEIEVEARAAEP